MIFVNGESSIVNEEESFYETNYRISIKLRCVALLCCYYNMEQMNSQLKTFFYAKKFFQNRFQKH